MAIITRDRPNVFLFTEILLFLQQSSHQNGRRQTRMRMWFQIYVFIGILSWSIGHFYQIGIQLNQIEVEGTAQGHLFGKHYSNATLEMLSQLVSVKQRTFKLDANEQRLFHILRQHTKISMSIEKQDYTMQLAKYIWANASRLYYSEARDGNTSVSSRDPVIIGLDRCKEFRRQWGSNASVAVASMFNAGSNALTKNLQLNLGIPGNNRSFWIMGEANLNGFLSQVPCWKHNPIIHDEVIGRQPLSIAHASVLPIVVIRDPYFWRKSMCTARYRLDWYRKNKGDCPGFFYRNATRRKDGEALLANHSIVIEKNGITFFVRDYRIQQNVKVKYPSLVDLWNAFYNQYLHASFPRLMIRFEDTLFHLPQVIQAVQECVGAYRKRKKELLPADVENSIMLPGHKRLPSVRVHSEAAKNHGNALKSGNASSLMATMIKNVDAAIRLYQMSEAELEYSRRTLDPTLMQLFRYSHPANTAIQSASDV